MREAHRGGKPQLVGGDFSPGRRLRLRLRPLHDGLQLENIARILHTNWNVFYLVFVRLLSSSKGPTGYKAMRVGVLKIQPRGGKM